MLNFFQKCLRRPFYNTSCLQGLRGGRELLIKARHKAVAHIDAHLSEKDIFIPLKITWNQVRDIIYESAEFVAKLAGATHSGAIGIGRDRRLIESTLRLINALQKN